MPFSPGSESAPSAWSSALRARRPLAEVGVLAAVLEVEELVADAAEGLHVDARAEVGAGAAGDAARPGCSSAGEATSVASWRE